MTTTLKDLREAYATAKKAGKEEFIFDGKIFATSYAMYLIQHLEQCGFRGDKRLNFTQEAFVV